MLQMTKKELVEFMRSVLQVPSWPEPMREAPPDGTPFFIPNIYNNCATRDTYYNQRPFTDWLDAGMIYDTREKAWEVLDWWPLRKGKGK